jgi:glycosyltransferase involved in cell wall biosynthesis
MTAMIAGWASSAPTSAPRRPLRVCLASMAPFVGGAEVAAERLGVGLRDSGHDVLMVLGTQNEVYDRMARVGLQCVHAPMYFTDKWHWLRYRQARQRLRRLFRQVRPDIVHSNDLPTHQIVSDALRGTGIPEVCHHRWFFDGTAVDWLNKFGCLHHVFVSQALMEGLIADSTRLRDSSRAILYDGLTLPPRPTPVSRRQARERLGLALDRQFVVFAGQIIERKGVADLLRAWCLIDPSVRQRADLVLLGDDVAGKGRYRVEMESLARKLNCPARFLGFQKDVSDWLLASDIAVVPSHSEPLGNATLEAMAVAVPVVGSAIGGIPEMVVHEQTGLLVPPHAPDQLAVAIGRLLLDPAARTAQGERARKSCEDRFSLQAHVAATLEQYRLVIDKRRRIAPGAGNPRARLPTRKPTISSV